MKDEKWAAFMQQDNERLEAEKRAFTVGQTFTDASDPSVTCVIIEIGIYSNAHNFLGNYYANAAVFNPAFPEHKSVTQVAPYQFENGGLYTLF